MFFLASKTRNLDHVMKWIFFRRAISTPVKVYELSRGFPEYKKKSSNCFGYPQVWVFLIHQIYFNLYRFFFNLFNIIQFIFFWKSVALLTVSNFIRNVLKLLKLTNPFIAFLQVHHKLSLTLSPFKKRLPISCDNTWCRLIS